MEKERGKLLNTRDALWDHVFFLLDGKFAMLSRPRAGFFDDADKRPLSLTSCFLSPFQKKQQQNSRHPRRRLVQVRTKNVFGLNFFSLFSRSPSFSLCLSLPLLSLTREEKKLNLVNKKKLFSSSSGAGAAAPAAASRAPPSAPPWASESATPSPTTRTTTATTVSVEESRKERESFFFQASENVDRGGANEENFC